MTIFLSKKIRAFTLLEMLLTMAMLTIIVGVAAPVYQSLQTKNSFVVDKNTLIQSIYKAQNLAQAAKNDSDWGVHFEEGSIVVYEGSDYINRNQNFDEVFKISKNNAITSDSDIIFNKFSGFPQSSTNMYINSSQGKSLIFTLNKVGLVKYSAE